MGGIAGSIDAGGSLKRDSVHHGEGSGAPGARPRERAGPAGSLADRQSLHRDRFGAGLRPAVVSDVHLHANCVQY